MFVDTKPHHMHTEQHWTLFRWLTATGSSFYCKTTDTWTSVHCTHSLHHGPTASRFRAW